MMAQSERAGRFSPWLIILGVVGCSGMVITVLCNTAGMFLAPVMNDSGWSRTEVSLFMTIFAWVAAVLQPVVGKILKKYDNRIIMTIVVAVFGACYIWSGTYTRLWQWNLFGVVYGVTAAFFMYLIGPILISAWFKKRMGLALSLGGVITGIFGFFVNPVIQVLIDNYGWGKARIYTGLATTAFCLIFTVLFVRTSPESAGVRAYGDDGVKNDDTEKDGAKNDGAILGERRDSAEAAPAEGIMLKEAIKTPAFYILIVFSLIVVIIPSLIQQLSSYAGSMPIGAMAAAFALSILSIIGLPRGPLTGWFFDLAGSKIGNFISYLLTALGMVLFLIGRGENAVLFYIGVILFSFSFIPLTLGNPMLTKETFGLKDYANIYSWMTTAVLVSGGIAPLIYAQIYDQTGSYTGCINLVLILCIVQMVFIPVISLTTGKKKA
jgi:MFS family permease